jgi:hypothetical protein
MSFLGVVISEAWFQSGVIGAYVASSAVDFVV